LAQRVQAHAVILYVGALEDAAPDALHARGMDAVPVRGREQVVVIAVLRPEL